MDSRNAKIHTILTSAVALLPALKELSSPWEKKWKFFLAISYVAVAAVAATLVYFVLTTRIAPLLIVLACFVPILVYAISQQSHYLTALQKEFLEYRSAVSEMVQFITFEVDTEMREELDALVAKVHAEEKDVTEIFRAIDTESAQMAEESADAVLEGVSQVFGGEAYIIQMKQSQCPDAPEEDTSIVI